MIPIIVITHGQFGAELLRTAQDIVGRQEAVFSISVTSETGAEGLGRSLDEALSQHPSPDGTLLLVDMLGGTPCNAAMLKTKNLHAEVIAGVNLYMAISAFRHRSTLALEPLAAKVADDARRAVSLPKDLLRKKADA